MLNSSQQKKIELYVLNVFNSNFRWYRDYDKVEDPHNVLRAYMVTIDYIIRKKEYWVDQIEQNPHIILSRPEITTVVELAICEFEREYQEEFERVSSQNPSN